MPRRVPFHSLQIVSKLHDAAAAGDENKIMIVIYWREWHT